MAEPGAHTVHSTGEKECVPVCVYTELLRVVLDPSGAIQTDCAESALADITASGLASKRILCTILLTQTSASSSPECEYKSVLMEGKEVANAQISHTLCYTERPTEIKCKILKLILILKLRLKLHITSSFEHVAIAGLRLLKNVYEKNLKH